MSAGCRPDRRSCLYQTINCIAFKKINKTQSEFETYSIYYKQPTTCHQGKICHFNSINHFCKKKERRNKRQKKKLTICFSEYLLDDSKLTASICPKSMSWPSRNMNSNLQTYFFFWYPSKVLSPLNLLRIFANSLLIRLISASLLLPKNK